jgi:hypothetical protein
MCHKRTSRNESQQYLATHARRDETNDPGVASLLNESDRPPPPLLAEPAHVPAATLAAATAAVPWWRYVFGVARAESDLAFESSIEKRGRPASAWRSCGLGRRSSHPASDHLTPVSGHLTPQATISPPPPRERSRRRTFLADLGTARSPPPSRAPEAPARDDDNPSRAPSRRHRHRHPPLRRCHRRDTAATAGASAPHAGRGSGRSRAARTASRTTWSRRSRDDMARKDALS